MGTETPNRDANSVDGDLSPSDGSLLDRFIREHSEEAFAQLMKRHGPYILGVCRRVTQHSQDAEDVFQACFLELARKASTISRRNSVVGWLQTVAVRTAYKAIAQRANREHRQTMYELRDLTAQENDIAWREIRRILEEELARLPENLRLPIILCFFEGKTQEEAAKDLKIKPRTLKDRISRGREMLRKQLPRRGVSLLAFGVLLSGSSTDAAVPVSLQQTTLRGATAVGDKAALSAVVPARVLSLMSGSVLLSRSPLLALGLAGLVLFGSTAYIAWGKMVGADVAASPITDVQNPVTLRRSFLGGQFDSTVFRWTGLRAESYARREQGGLRLTLPNKGGPGQPVGIMLRYPLRGDFEIEATWELVRVVRPPSGVGVGPTVYCYIDSPLWDGIWLGKLLHPTQGSMFVAAHRYKPGDERTDKFVKTIAAGNELGMARLRVIRRGTFLSVSGAEQLGDEFQLIATSRVGPEDASIVRFAVDPASSTGAEVDVRLVDVSIKADKLIGYAP